MQWSRYFLLCLSVLGALFSLYLYHVHLQVHLEGGVEGGFCSIRENFQCISAAKSSWSSVLGIPLPAWGLGYYLGLMTLLGFQPLLSLERQRASRVLCGILILGSVAYSLFLFTVSLVALKALCPFCALLYLVNISSLATLPWFLSNNTLHEITPFHMVKPLVGFTGILGASLLTATVHMTLAMDEGKGEEPITLLAKEWSEAQAQYQKTGVPSSDGKPIPLTKPAYLGSPKAKVVVVVFSDLVCGFCRKAHDALHEIVEQYPEQVQVQWRHFPLESRCNPMVRGAGHPNSCLASQLVIAAQAQGKANELARLYFEILDLPTNKRTKKLYLQAAARLNLNVSQLKACLRSENCLSRLQEDVTEGMEQQIFSTPTLFINGQKLEGFPGRVALEQQILQAMER